jgi:hypothetical protein
VAQYTKGTRFRSCRDLKVNGIISYGAPFSDGFEGLLPASEVLVLDSDPLPNARGMWHVPERYEHFETIFVPSHDRAHEAYGGYAVAINYEYVGEDIEVLQ